MLNYQRVNGHLNRKIMGNSRKTLDIGAAGAIEIPGAPVSSFHAADDTRTYVEHMKNSGYG